MKNNINHIWVFRQAFKKISTRGQMYLNGVFQGYTLEDEVRGDNIKIAKHTAIKTGTYEVVKHSTKKFPKALRLENVPGFVGILIHGGLNEKHTDGCLLLGEKKNDIGVDESVLTYRGNAVDLLTEKIWQDIDKGIPCYITITNSPEIV